MQHHHFPFHAMGTPCELQLFAPSRQSAEQIATAVRAEVERLEARYSRYRPDSLLSAINRVAAQGGEIEVDAETAGLLHYADTCYRESGGLFDVSSGVLRRAWRLAEGRLPAAIEIESLLRTVGWDKLRWQSPRLVFSLPGMELDLGGVVKEYAVDRAASLCLAAGLHHALINLGGDVRAVGPRGDGSAWQIGIRDPFKPAQVLQTLALSSGALASSGDYERCMVIDGVRYGHVLHPHTGWPVRGLTAVSVQADLCVVAGSATTIAMLKQDQGPAWLASLGLPCLWVTDAGQIGGSLAAMQNPASAAHGSL